MRVDLTHVADHALPLARGLNRLLDRGSRFLNEWSPLRLRHQRTCLRSSIVDLNHDLQGTRRWVDELYTAMEEEGSALSRRLPLAELVGGFKGELDRGWTERHVRITVRPERACLEVRIDQSRDLHTGSYMVKKAKEEFARLMAKASDKAIDEMLKQLGR